MISKIKSFFGLIFFMFRYSWGVSKKIFFTTAIQIALNVIEPVIIVILPKYIIDALINQQGYNVVILYILILIVSLAIKKAIALYTNAVVAGEYNKMQSKTGGEYIGYSLKMDYPLLEDGKMTELSQRIKYNVRCSNFIGDDVAEFLTSIFILLSFSYIVLSINIWLLVVLLISTILEYFISKKIEDIKFKWQTSQAFYNRRYEYYNNMMFTLPFAKEIRVNKMSRWLINHYQKHSKRYEKDLKKQYSKNIIISFLQILNVFVRNFFVYILSIFQVIFSSLSLGSFFAYIGAVQNFADALQKLVAKINFFIVFTNNIKDYNDFRQIVIPTTSDGNADNIEPKINIIEFDKVSFKYANMERFILENVSFSIKHGEKLSIVGINGAGKSTIAKLICKLYKPNSGRILFNGVDIWEINNSSYVKLISIIYQDFEMFSFSIKENIILNNEFDNEMFNHALEMSGSKKIVDTLPEKEKTIIYKEFDDNGVDLSTGESQKIAMARSVYKNSKIFILDEPASALDPQAENALYEKFNELTEQKATIYISHRLSSSSFCDNIMVLNNGHVEEFGTHAQLIANNRLYAKMYTTQSQFYKESAGE